MNYKIAMRKAILDPEERRQRLAAVYAVFEQKTVEPESLDSSADSTVKQSQLIKASKVNFSRYEQK